ncbi:MAG: hypothetical protein EOP10_17615 [Proteobacteria bacterium]|nr:MAG: hypothetical protein EOP10_17615 [Pseudomonadota bacterium]
MFNLNRLWKIFAFVSFSYTLTFEVASAQNYDCFAKMPEAGKYNHTYNLSYNSTLVSNHNAYSSRYLELDGKNGYTLSKDGQAFVYYRGQKLFDDLSEKYVALDTQLGYRHRLCLDEDWLWSASVVYSLPVNHDVQKYDHSRGYVSIPTSFIWNDESNLNITLRATTRRYFYQYTDNEGGKTLKQWAFEPGIMLAYTLDDLTFNADFYDYIGWDFNGAQLYSEYLHEESIDWAATKKWTISLMHRSDGRVANYAGTGYDIALHDKDRSEIAIGLSFTE